MDELKLLAAPLETAIGLGEAFDVIVLWAGSNDPEERLLDPNPDAAAAVAPIVAAVSSLIAAAADHARHVVVLTVPPRRGESDRSRARRLALNAALLAAPGYVLLDIAACLPPHDEDAADKEDARVWDADGVHLTRRGYDVVGDAVFDRLRDAGMLATQHEEAVPAAAATPP